MSSKSVLILRSAAAGVLALFAVACVAQTTIHVGPGQTYTTIQSGIDAANNGDTVLVAPGTYNENIDFKGKAITVTSSGGAARTIIDGGAASGTATVNFRSSETRSSVLSNFTVRNGGGGTFASTIGGGIYVFESSPTILQNIITANACDGIDVEWGAALIQGNTISGTTLDGNAYCSFQPVGIDLIGNLSSTMFSSVIGNNIENNNSPNGEDAAAISIWDSNGNVIVGNIIRNNISAQGAVVMFNSDSIIFSQNLVYGNSVSGNLSGYGGGGALYLAIPDGAPPFYGIIANNTFANNTTSLSLTNASQIFIDGDVSQFSFVNNIVYGTGTTPLLVCNGIYVYLTPGPMLVENNDVYNPSGPAYDSSCANGAGMAGNLAVDPQFVNPSKDFHLQSGSPGIDTGNNQALAMLTPYGVDLATDLDGKARIQDATGKGCIIDMGAYEAPGTASQCGFETLTSSLNPAFAGQSVTFTAQLTSPNGTPTGTVQFLDGGSALSTQPVSAAGSSAYTTNSLTVGSHTISANFQPTGIFSPSTASVVEVINGNQTAAVLTCSPNPIDVFKSAQLTASVSSGSGTPTGTVSFTDNGSPLAASTLAAGVATITYTPSVAATHTIVATYVPTGAYAASSATCSEVVNPLPTTAALTVSPANSTYGSAIMLTAKVSATTPPGPSTPTGVVTFYNGGSALGTGTLTAGVASVAVNSLIAGSYSFSCIYGGSPVYGTSDCNTVSASVTAAPTALSLTSSGNPATYLSPVTLAARLTINGQSAGAGNTIHLGINGQSVTLTTDASGSAMYTPGTLQAGSYPVTASFAGTNNLLASSASLTEVIASAATSTSLAATPNPGDQNQGVTLTASVTSAAGQAPNGGNVTFYDGSTSLGSAPVTSTGAASLDVVFTVLGVHTLTAVYGGDTDFSPSTSAVLQETINAGDFTVTAAPGSAALYTGESATVQVNVASLRGFNQSLALSCAGLPANTSCEFTPATLTQGQGGVNLVIKTSAPQEIAAGSISTLGGLLLLFMPLWKRRRRGFFVHLCAVLLAAGVAVALGGCSSHGSISGGTPPGSYAVAVTASTAGTSAPVVHSAVVMLTVKSLF